MNSKDTRKLTFLSGGGEMAALTRNRDWSKTVLGNPKTWPQSLRTTLSILLNSKFPMFLFWGRELTCFYNDAYRPSLGLDGKHPAILGMPGEQAWPEIWVIIKPLIDQVLSGEEATWSEDQLIPIYRNGHIEDVYWTFSYSPVSDESETVAGVMVTCSETTEKINSHRKLADSMDQLQFAIESAELGTWDFNPATNKFISNNRLKSWFGLPAGAELDLTHAMSAIAGKDRERVTHAIAEVLNFSSGGKYEIEYSILNPHTQQEMIVQARGKAFFNDKNIANRFNGTLQDVTKQVLARKKIEESEKRFRNTVEQAPLGITIFRGPEFVIEMANQTYLQIIGRTEEAVLGKPLFDEMPEIRDIAEPLLTAVLKTGEPKYGRAFPVTINRYGKSELVYFDFIYHPLREDNGDISGIIIVAAEVSEAVSAMLKVEESEKRFRNVADSAPVLIWMAGTDKLRNFFNKAWLNFSGRSIEKEAGNGWTEGIHPDDFQRCMDVYNKSFENRREFYMEYRLKRHDDEYRWVSDTGVPRFTGDGIFEGYIGACMDIHENTLYQNNLKEKEERLNIVVSGSDLATWDLNLQTRDIYYSEKYMNLLGYKAGTVLPHSALLKHIHPDDMPTREKAFAEAFDNGILYYISRLIAEDGSTRWVENRGKVFYDFENKPLKLIGTTRDITEQKMFASEMERQVQERIKELKELNLELKKSEERYHLMVEEVQDYAILYLNKEGTVENWNKGAQKIKGYTAKEIIGKNFSVFYTESDRKNSLPATLLKRATETGRAVQEGFRVRRDGSLFWANVVITAVHDEQKNVIGFSKVTHDLTEKKAAEDKLKLNAHQLEQKNKELQAMNTELQSFAYVSSHDLQEPLRKIQVFASMIKQADAKSLSEDGKSYLDRMETAAARMQTLILDLLAYSRTNITERNFEKTDLNRIVDNVKAELKDDIRQKNAIIEVDELCEAEIIPFQFHQLLINLIGNALKFSIPGKAPHIQVKGTIEKPGALHLAGLYDNKAYCHVKISDNGIGFEPRYRDKIFEVFQRLHGKSEYRGTGIGLAIVKKIVDNHDGIITASGEVNKGASFDIYLPVTE